MTHDRISIDPGVMFGKPVIRGTRVPVEHILRKLAAGLAMSEILETYPRVTEADVLAALAYAADALSREEVIVQRAA